MVISQKPAKSICIFCSSSENLDKNIILSTINLVKKIALIQPPPNIIYGGVNCGLMKIVADAYKEAGGKVIGIIPEFMLNSDLPCSALYNNIIVSSLNDRKAKMIELSDLFLVLPGGIGTFDEFFNVLAYKQLKLHNKPILIYNINDFYKPLLDLITHCVINNTITKDNISLFSVTNNSDEIIEFVKKL